jgi:butyryl-CoA dehydrogenase
VIYNLTEKQAEMRQRGIEFAREYVAPYAQEWDMAEEFPLELFQKIAEEGFVGYPFPKKYGGMGGNYLEYCTLVEEIARVDASASLVMCLNASLVTTPILLGGNDRQKDKWLPPLCKGELIGAFCLTEPTAGSDASNLSSYAYLDGDEYVLNGEKIFITHGNVADITIVVCRIAKQEGGRPRISILVVDDMKNRAGVKQAKLENKLGIRASTTGRIEYRDVRVPKENLLGEIGTGFRTVLATLDGGRTGIAAQALGIAQGAFDRALEYAKARHQWGQPIIKTGAVQSMIANMATKTEAARSLVYRACQVRDAGGDYKIISSMAKLFASRVAHEVACNAVQVFGGYGYIGSLSDVDRFLRDSRITEIYEGTSQIQELVIATELAKADRPNDQVFEPNFEWLTLPQWLADVQPETKG